MAAILSRAPITSALAHMQNSPAGLEQGCVTSVKPRDTPPPNAQEMPQPALVCEAVVLLPEGLLTSFESSKEGKELLVLVPLQQVITSSCH